MKSRNAIASFLGICVILAVLLITKLISSVLSGIIFAIALVIFGSLSKGFRRNYTSSKSKKKNAI